MTFNTVHDVLAGRVELCVVKPGDADSIPDRSIFWVRRNLCDQDGVRRSGWKQERAEGDFERGGTHVDQGWLDKGSIYFMLRRRGGNFVEETKQGGDGCLRGPSRSLLHVALSLFLFLLVGQDDPTSITFVSAGPDPVRLVRVWAVQNCFPRARVSVLRLPALVTNLALGQWKV